MFGKVSKRLFSSLPDNATVVVSFARTPIGNMSGSLGSLTAPKLGAHCINAAVDRIGLDRKYVEEVLIGNVVSAGIGQAPDRQAALGAGLPIDCPATLINKVCSSGMKATMLAAMSISSNYRGVMIAGGMESMTNIPYYLVGARKGYRMGNQTVVDGMIHDGLWDIYNNHHMGNCGEVCSKKYNITRADQDNFAKKSNERAIAAWNSGKFSWEVAPVTLENNKGQKTVVDKDEGILSYEPEKMSKLKPAFLKEGGTVTAGNSSKLSDGAAMLVLMSAKRAKELNMKPLFRIRGFGDSAKEPVDFTTAPALAIPRALANSNLQLSDVDLHEINEAFAVVPLVNALLLNLDLEKVNVLGGAVSLGHPIGCSGARILGTLYSALKHSDKSIGCASICNGGGGASAVVIERLD